MNRLRLAAVLRRGLAWGWLALVPIGLGACGDARQPAGCWGTGPTVMPPPQTGLPGGSVRRQAEAVRAQLAAQREEFRRTRDPVLVFGVFYEPVTVAVLEQADAGSLRNPDFWLAEVVEFHADYVRNLDPVRREPHWQPYFGLAEGLRGRRFRAWQVAGPLDLAGAHGLTGHGVAAHIGTDLPRSLDRVWRRGPVRDMAGLEADFRALAAVFPEASRRGFATVVGTFGMARAWPLAILPGRDRIAGWRIEAYRREAWRRFHDSRKAAGARDCPFPSVAPVAGSPR